MLRLDRQIMKKWMQGIGLIYILLLLGVCVPGVAGGNAQNDIGETLYLIRSENPKKGTDRKTEQPKIALTFDDGPNAQFTPLLLDGLKKRGVKATFFLIGKNIETGNNADIVKREWEEGHLLGNHTYNHVEITRVSNDTAYQEIKATNDLISEITGAPVEYMRPPFGLWQKKLEQRIHVLPVMWTVDPLDWATDNEDEIVNKVVTEAGENDIILLHDCYDSSVDAALRIVDILMKKGYEFVTADELIMD